MNTEFEPVSFGSRPDTLLLDDRGIWWLSCAHSGVEEPVSDIGDEDAD